LFSSLSRKLIRLLTHLQIQTKLSHPAELQKPPCLLHLSFAPPSVSDKLHIIAVPSTEFPIRLNRLQQMAYLLVTMSEIPSDTVLLEMGFKHEMLQHNNSEVLGFATRNRGIVVANDMYLPYDRTGNATLNLTLLIIYV
jgi:hypothetical protein